MESCEHFERAWPCGQCVLGKFGRLFQTGTIDRILLNMFAAGKDFCPGDLTRMVEALPKECADGSEGSQDLYGPDDQPGMQVPNRKILSYLARKGFKEAAFAYFYRFPAASPERVTHALEGLQLSSFNEILIDFYDACREVLRGNILNFFRLAQKIRDEQGITRKNAPANCFRSFEDIVELERKIRGGDAVGFVCQCLALRLVNYRHSRQMYETAKSFAQLEAIHEKLGPLETEYRDFETALNFTTKFRALISERPNSPPTWQNVRKYLELTTRCLGGEGIIFGTHIATEDLDDALNLVLGCALRIAEFCYYYWNGDALDEATKLLHELLKRGASLFFKQPGEGRSTFEMLVELARGIPPLISELSPYICCPLTLKITQVNLYDSESKITVDRHRPSRLTCVAARRVPPERDLRLPGKLRSFVEVHRDLKCCWDEKSNPSFCDCVPSEICLTCCQAFK